MISYTIYIVDDEEALAKGMAAVLRKDYTVKPFFNGRSAFEAVKASQPDLVLLDIGLPDISGIEVLRKIKENFPDVVVIMITAFEKLETAISAMKNGAYDYVVKPVKMEAIEISIRNALETIRLKKEVKALQEQRLKEELPCFIGNSKAISDVMAFVENVSKSPDTPVLIMGESGTGKELIAAAIHYRSPNFKGALVPVNCAAIPKDLIESELFGYEGGAFSGASKTGKKGLVEQADQGTLFLDEIGDLSLEAQAKLLRFLESGEFYKVGSTKKITIKTRVVSATNKDLNRMIEDRKFREDLFYRVGVVRVKVPSLAERREDIMPIAKHFLMEFGKKFGKAFAGFSPEAEDALLQYEWTGNVRELKNIIELAALTAKKTILSCGDLRIKMCREQDPPALPQETIALELLGDGVDLSSILESVEKKYIAQALKVANGNETRAAKLLNLKATTFRYRRQKLGIG